MDFNFYASSNAQPYEYFGYGDTGPLGSGMGADGMDIYQSLEDLMDNLPLGGPFEYSSINVPGHSASPPDQYISMLPSISIDSGIADLDAEPSERRDSSEDKETLTPAQTRRKAQNRAAQRAFRERKERHVKDLEAQLHALTSATQTLQSENSRLKRQLQRFQTKNEAFRGTKATTPPRPSPAVEPRNNNNNNNNDNYHSPRSPCNGTSRLLSLPQTWDLLQSHPLFTSGHLDLGEVCERLKSVGASSCEGSWSGGGGSVFVGPGYFDEAVVRGLIEGVGGCGGEGLGG